MAPDLVGLPTKHRPEFYYPLFDYVRAAAAIGVFVGHADRYGVLPANIGYISVKIFFALSGFLIGGILLRSKAADISLFYFNRATRIWIPYALAIFLLFSVTLVKQGLSDPKFSEFFFYMVTFVYNWFGPPQLAQFVHRMPLDGTGNHFWSICVEEQFYLIAPFLLLMLNRYVAAAVLTGLVVLNLFYPHEFASISLGVLFAIAGRALWFSVGSIAMAAAAIYFLPYASWVPFVSVAVVAIAAQPGRPSNFGRIIGGASFPFYLNHWVGLFAISAALKIGISYAIGSVIGFAVAVILSVGHYLVIDRWIAEHRSEFFRLKRGYWLCLIGFALVAFGIFAWRWR